MIPRPQSHYLEVPESGTTLTSTSRTRTINTPKKIAGGHGQGLMQVRRYRYRCNHAIIDTKQWLIVSLHIHVRIAFIHTSGLVQTSGLRSDVMTSDCPTPQCATRPRPTHGTYSVISPDRYIPRVFHLLHEPVVRRQREQCRAERIGRRSIDMEETAHRAVLLQEFRGPKTEIGTPAAYSVGNVVGVFGAIH